MGNNTSSKPALLRATRIMFAPCSAKPTLTALPIPRLRPRQTLRNRQMTNTAFPLPLAKHNLSPLPTLPHLIRKNTKQIQHSKIDNSKCNVWMQPALHTTHQETYISTTSHCGDSGLIASLWGLPCASNKHCVATQQTFGRHFTGVPRFNSNWSHASL